MQAARNGSPIVSFAVMHRWPVDFINSKKPCHMTGLRKERLILPGLPSFTAETLFPRLFSGSELFTKTANADARQGKTKVNASVSHLLHCNRARNCICHVTHFVGRPRLQDQRRFSGNDRSAE